jgi:phenylalanyl-tRNA synthetase alpha chain
LHRHEIAVLNALRKNKRLSLKAMLDETGLGRDEAMWAVQNLEVDGLVDVHKEAKEDASLTDEGKKYANEGLPEHALLGKLGSGQMDIRKLSGKEEQIGFMWAKKKGLVAIDKGMVKLTEKGKEKARKRYSGRSVPTKTLTRSTRQRRQSLNSREEAYSRRRAGRTSAR